MHLQIRNPRAHELAHKIARQRHASITDVVVQALESEYRRVAAHQPLAQRLESIACDLAGMARSGRRDMAQGEVDAMWGHD